MDLRPKHNRELTLTQKRYLKEFIDSEEFIKRIEILENQDHILQLKPDIDVFYYYTQQLKELGELFYQKYKLSKYWEEE